MSAMGTEGQDSQNIGTEPVDTQGQEAIETPAGGDQQQNDTGINPAWNDLLSSVPAGLHSQITPHLTKWDQNFQSKIGEVHSQYEPYKPFIENQVAPDQINYALGILNAIEERPQEVLQALQAYMGLDIPDEQGQNQNLPPQDNGPSDQPDWVNHPEFQRMNEMVNTMAQLLVQQRESEANAQYDSQLESDLSAAKDKFGDYDEEWVLTKLLNNPDMSVEKAVESFKEFENGILSRHRQPGPPVLPAGGSVPNPSFDPTKLGDKDRRATVAQMLQQAAQQQH